MKQHLIIALIFLSYKSISQIPSFEVNGIVNTLDSGEIELYFPKDDSISKNFENKTRITKGKFTLNGLLGYPRAGIFIIHSDKGQEIQTGWVYIDIGKQTITIQQDSLSTSVTSNSKIYNEFVNKFNPFMSLLRIEKGKWRTNYGVLLNKYNQNIPSSIEDSMTTIMSNLKVQTDSFLLSYIKQNPQSYIGLSELSGISAYEYKPIYDSCFFYLDTKLKNNSLGQKINTHLKNLASPFGIDSLMPSISIIDTIGHQLFFNKGLLKKFTLIDFWYHNCGWCLRQIPSLQKIYAKWQPYGFEIIGISTDSKTMEVEWKNTITKYNLSWTQYCDPQGLEARKLSVYSFPSNFLLDESGKVIAKNIELVELENFLKTKLNQ